MSKVLLVVALSSASVVTQASDRVECSVSVRTFDDQGRLRPVRHVSATAPAVVFQGRVEGEKDEAPALLFDVFSPRGLRYQTLAATAPSGRQRSRRRFHQPSRTPEAALAVAGSSISWTSMYGRWRVEPRVEGASEACGKPEYFTIRP